MRSRHVFLVPVLVLTLGIAGCAQAPTNDVDAAKRALGEAEQASAVDYAPAAWSAAKDAEAKLDAELEAQKENWALLRSYSAAQQLARQVKSEAERATKEAAVAKGQARTDAEALMAQAREAHGRVQAALRTAPRGKGTEADLASLRSDTSSIDGTLQEMQQLFDAGDYLGAKTKAQSAIDAAKRIEAEIEQARTRRGAA